MIDMRFSPRHSSRTLSAALDTGLPDAFETSASRVALSREALDRRLLLCLYGLGMNAGLKRIAGATLMSATTSCCMFTAALSTRRR